MSESGTTKHSYLFCQYINPERGHEGDCCDCFDTSSQRKTRIAKQRLARLRTDRQPTLAKNTTNKESAVASDPAVTAGAKQETELIVDDDGAAGGEKVHCFILVPHFEDIPEVGKGDRAYGHVVELLLK
jgi:hypothetical protein